MANEKTPSGIDPIVLGEDYILYGEEIGVTRPNDNCLIDGASGTGKSTNTLFPTMCRMEKMSGIAPFSKEEEAVQIANYLRTKGYRDEYLNLIAPARSTVIPDFVKLLDSPEEIERFSSDVVNGVMRKTSDSYWIAAAENLNRGLIYLSKMLKKGAGTLDYLELFDKTVPIDTGIGFRTELHPVIEKARRISPGCCALRALDSWLSLPYRTAAGIRDTLSSALETVFPESIRIALRGKPQIDFDRLVDEKSILYVISDASDRSQAYFANLFWSAAIHELRKIARHSPGGRLPRNIRLYFGDFGCTCPIRDFEKDISIFRSAGISCFIILQSQSQLENLYGSDKAAVIRQNCPVQVYFPGGLDDRSCELVSRRMNIPASEVMYAPIGKVFIMQSCRRPVITNRYDAYRSEEYRLMVEANRNQTNTGGDPKPSN